MAKQRTSPWFYAGCGCCGLVGLAVLAIAGVGIFGASVATHYFEDLKDPDSRNQRARAILGAEELPADYHALLFFRIPWFLEAAILTDGPPVTLGEAELEEFSPLESGYVGDHLFVYLEMRGGSDDIESVFRGRGRSGNVELDFDSSFESSEQLSEGAFDVAGGRLTYTAHRGDLTTEDGDRTRGIYSEMKIDCQGDGKGRTAVWFARDPEGAGAPPDLPGTPGDESALEAFMAHFNLCTG